MLNTEQLLIKNTLLENSKKQVEYGFNDIKWLAAEEDTLKYEGKKE